MKKGSQLKEFGAKFKLDSHHNIERFGVLFVLITALLSLVIVGAFFSARSNSAQTLHAKSLYVDSFTTSKTNLSGKVDGVYVSTDKTKALVFMKFNKPSDVSLDASDYQGFLTGANIDLGQEKLASAITGEIITFGSTGYFGVLLTSDVPFEPQILSLTLRANAELVYTQGDPSVRKDLKDDASFEKFDQWQIYFNPGGSEAEVLPALDSGKINVGNIYAELVTTPQEEVVRGKFNETLKQMSADLTRIDAYENELSVTSSLDGDKLVNPRGDNPDPILIPIAADEIINIGGTGAQSGDEQILQLRTEWVNPKGFNFDWRSGSVYEGYLDEIVPPGQKYGEWLAAKSEMVDSYTSDGQSFSITKLVWRLSDGRTLEDAQKTSTTEVMAPLVTLRMSLDEAYSAYYKNKQTYQVTLPMELLSLEISLRNVESSYSINDLDAILTY